MTRVYWISPNFNHYKKKFLSRLAIEEQVDLVVLAGQPPKKEGHKEDEADSPFQIDRVSTTKRWFGVYPPVYWELLKAAAWGRFDAIMMPAQKRFILPLLWLFILRIFTGFRLVTYSHPYMRSRLDKVTKSDLLWSKIIFSFYDKVIFYTKDSRKWAIENNLLPDYKADYANNTLDTEDISKYYDFEINLEQPKRILFIGRLVENKRIDVLLEYFKELKKDLPGLALTVIGDGPAAHVIHDAIKSEPNICYLGSVVDEAKIAAEMKRSHVVFIPGWSGLSIVHAFAYGKPYVTLTGMTHAPELSYLQHEINGLLLASTKKENIVKLRNLLSDPERYSKMCLNAYNTAQELSIDKWCERMAKAMKSVRHKEK